MKGRFTYEMPSPTATALVGLSHRGSRLECHAAAAMRQPYGGPMGVFAEFPNSGAAGISICNAGKRMVENTLQDFGYMYDIFANLAARKDNKR